MAEVQQQGTVRVFVDGQEESVGGEPTQLEQTIAEFIPTLGHYDRTFFNSDLHEHTEIHFRGVLHDWNTFLQRKQGSVAGRNAGGQDSCAVVSRNIKNDIAEFMSLSQKISCGQMSQYWLAWWNRFLQVQQGEFPVSAWGAILTTIGLLCYVVDLGTDVFTAVQYGYGGFWWQCSLTLCMVYSGVAISVAYQWLRQEIRWTGSLDILRYLGPLLVNWPDLQECWSLFHLEWKLLLSPRSNAYLLPVWQERRLRVAMLKFTEGVFEACPQALLQLVLLLPELQGDSTWTVSFRIVATTISLFTAGTALVNRVKADRFRKTAVLPLSELILLHVWVIAVTVSRLLCLALFLSLHLHGALVCMALHLVLYAIYYWCSTEVDPRTPSRNMLLFLNSVLFLVSPFNAPVARPSLTVRHLIHFLGNAGMMVVWALSTPMYHAQPVLYATLTGTIPAIFTIGLLGWLLHWKYYKQSVPPRHLTNTQTSQPQSHTAQEQSDMVQEQSHMTQEQPNMVQLVLNKAQQQLHTAQEQQHMAQQQVNMAQKQVDLAQQLVHMVQQQVHTSQEQSHTAQERSHMAQRQPHRTVTHDPEATMHNSGTNTHGQTLENACNA